mgnify:CR=1 FL=1
MTAAELSNALGREVRSVEASPVAYASSHPLQQLDVRFDDGTESRLVLKDAGTLLPVARGAKPRFVQGTDRELEVYRDVLARFDAPAPRLVAIRGRQLLLEHVAGAPLTEVGERSVWERAARTAGSMHRRLRGRRAVHLLRYDRPYFARWLDRASCFAGDPVEALRQAYLEAVDRLLTLPTTLIHGELYPSNVVVAGERICFLDWETAGVATGLLDLAALSSGSWSARERQALAAAYAASLGDTLEAELLADLERCRLVIAVQWLGWSRTWSPPQGHRQDWLAEARRAAGAIT